MPTRHSHRTPPLALALLLAILGAGGCGYSVRAPFAGNIQTVYVPMFKSTSFRRDLNIQLTKKIQDEITARTPFVVVDSPDGADSILEGTIQFVDKNASVENPNNLPRQIMNTVVASVKWTDHRQGRSKSKELSPVSVVENVTFTPEIGETVTLGFDKALNKLARQVVDMMEEPW